MARLAAAVLFVAAGFSTAAFAAPRADHPRLFLNSENVATLRSWATSSNAVYSQGLLAAANQAKQLADQHWNWTTGLPDTGWRDDGWIGNNFSPGTNFPHQNPTEGYAMLFAFMALVDPSSQSARDGWALRAHAMVMYVINQAVLGQANLPFRYPTFATFDRASVWLEGVPLTVDWIYASFSAADKAKIRTVFLRWASELNVAVTVVYDHPEPPGVTNSLDLLGSGPSQTADDQAASQLMLLYASNNYYLAHFRNLVLLGGALDASDDPAVDASKPRTQLGNSVNSYLLNGLGSWLYQLYAMFESPAIVNSDYGIAAIDNGTTPTNPVIGRTSGGFPVEGSLYGAALAYLAEATLALDTLGYNDTATYGPQLKLIDSAFWDRRLDYTFHNSTSAPHTPLDLQNYGYLTPFYHLGTYGDTIRVMLADNEGELYGAMAWQAQRRGFAARYNKARWIDENMFPGGFGNLTTRASGDGITNTYFFPVPIFLFLGEDPTRPKAADPRPLMWTRMIDPALGILRARSSWNARSTWFTFRCGAMQQPHVNGDCLQFELYRNGEWLTREAAGYNSLSRSEVADYHNSLALQNDPPQQTLPELWYFASTYGGQFSNDGALGDPTVSLSTGPAYAYAYADATPLYNHSGGQYYPLQSVTGVAHASRSIVWLDPDVVVAFDRARSKSPSRFKKFDLLFTHAPAINGNTATVTTKSGQVLDIRTLLPASATLSADVPARTTQANGDETSDRLIVEDTSQPMDGRFLHVLQALDAGAAAKPVSKIGSSSGNFYQGALVGSDVVLFPDDPSQVFNGMTYTVPVAFGKHLRHFIGGLKPNSNYSVTVTGSDVSTTVTITPGGEMFADAAGLLFVVTPDEIFFDFFGG